MRISDGSVSFVTAKNKAKYYPQDACKHFHEHRTTFECDCLNECYCALEKKQCSFYDSRIKQRDPVPIGLIEENPEPITPELFAKMLKYHNGRSWEQVATHFAYTTKQVNDARIQYAMLNPRKLFTDDMLRDAVRMKTDGMTWRYIAQKLGVTESSLKSRLKRDRENGIYHW